MWGELTGDASSGVAGSASRAAVLVDRLLTCVARQHGALDVAIGEGLHALEYGERLLRLGYVRVGDYGREQLGLGSSTARNMARLAHELAFRPLLAAAVRSGELTTRKAQTILPVALGEAEAPWIERAKRSTVRRLEADVRAAGGATAEEQWSHVEVQLAPSEREVVNRAMATARRLLGHEATEWELLEAICEEFLSAHPVDEPEAPGDPAARKSTPADLDLPALRRIDEESEKWLRLADVDGIAAPEPDTVIDAFGIHARLRELRRMQSRWDGLVGRLVLSVQTRRWWRELGFRTFAQYCSERLQMSVRTVQQRAALERRLCELPALRKALDDGRLNYEKARIVARHATAENLEEWIARAQKVSCLTLIRETRDAAEGDADAQMCSSASLRMAVPAFTADLLGAVCLAVMHLEGAPKETNHCLALAARHFLEVWEPILEKRRKTWRDLVLERDKGRCQVPGCSRAARHVHHIIYSSRGGTDDEWNLISLCIGHHLLGVHQGYLEIEGEAPDGLTWRLGVRPAMDPLQIYGPRRKEEPMLAA